MPRRGVPGCPGRLKGLPYEFSDRLLAPFYTLESLGKPVRSHHRECNST